ncbi:hypothetical protein PRUPE_3G174400 [Prunus persica]|uniref:Uncharacterized protein n=1 Tax=Prunus persica TaxID=3760 RepID=A0A251Q1J9_PRUPE|nr:hypothetical protein PRUPE_3G174400 [Prunus persica]
MAWFRAEVQKKICQIHKKLLLFVSLFQHKHHTIKEPNLLFMMSHVEKVDKMKQSRETKMELERDWEEDKRREVT